MLVEAAYHSENVSMLEVPAAGVVLSGDEARVALAEDFDHNAADGLYAAGDADGLIVAIVSVH